jgi:hypothetical protein
VQLEVLFRLDPLERSVGRHHAEEEEEDENKLLKFFFFFLSKCIKSVLLYIWYIC